MADKSKAAFPRTLSDREHNWAVDPQPGMTLHEYYAGLAMQAVIASKQEYYPEFAAEMAVGYAAALLAALKKEEMT